MPGLGKEKARGGTYRFRVSDVVDVPLRGTVLRLRVVEGTPALADLGPGSTIRLRAPDGAERTVTITAFAVSMGKPSQERLDRYRELDVVISDEEAVTGGPVEIGWTASGPAE